MVDIKINLGMVCPEIVGVANAIGADRCNIIASYQQVTSSEGTYGYSGYNMRDLCQVADVPVWRDHCGGVIDPSDVKCGVDGFMPETSGEGLLRSLGPEHGIEVGYGEARKQTKYPWSGIWSGCSYAGLEPSHISQWLGTQLGEGKNTLLKHVAVHNIVPLLNTGLIVRAHNCDFLARDDLRYLRDLGVTEFNFAPEMGKVLADAALFRLKDSDEYALRDTWMAGTECDPRWHKTQWTYSAHYSYTSIIGLQEYCSKVVKEALISWAETRLSWLV